MEKEDRINSDQFYELITGEEVSWQSIIYDLVKTEQLDPWDIDISLLANKYAEFIDQLEDANFFVSSKVLLACSLLLRLKSEILSNRYIQELDEQLFGKKEEKRYELERIELDEDELPILVPRTPMPRYKKVTLKELMASLNQAIETENRRIRKDIKQKQAERSALVVIPRKNRIPLKDRIRVIFQSINTHIKTNHDGKQVLERHMKFSDLAKTKKEKIDSFMPVLQLSNDQKIYLRQPKHFGEIFLHIEVYESNDDLLEKIEEAMESAV